MTEVTWHPIKNTSNAHQQNLEGMNYVKQFTSTRKYANTWQNENGCWLPISTSKVGTQKQQLVWNATRMPIQCCFLHYPLAASKPRHFTFLFFFCSEEIKRAYEQASLRDSSEWLHGEAEGFDESTTNSQRTSTKERQQTRSLVLEYSWHRRLRPEAMFGLRQQFHLLNAHQHPCQR